MSASNFLVKKKQEAESTDLFPAEAVRPELSVETMNEISLLPADLQGIAWELAVGAAARGKEIKSLRGLAWRLSRQEEVAMVTTDKSNFAGRYFFTGEETELDDLTQIEGLDVLDRQEALDPLSLLLRAENEIEQEALEAAALLELEEMPQAIEVLEKLREGSRALAQRARVGQRRAQQIVAAAAKKIEDARDFERGAVGQGALFTF